MPVELRHDSASTLGKREFVRCVQRHAGRNEFPASATLGQRGRGLLRDGLLMMKRFVLLLAGAMPAMLAQDSSGNRMLSGTYRFREIAIVNFDANGNPVETVAASGAITFDGAGHYVANGSTLDSAASTRS